MKKIVLILIFLLALLAIAFQSPNQYARRIFPVFQDPSLPCSEASVYYNLTTHKFLICKNTGIEEVGGALGSGIAGLNGQGQVNQTFAVGTSGTNFNISSSGGIHTFNIPDSSGTNRGLLISSDWTNFNSKQGALGFTPENSANKNIANGYAGLNSSAKIPANLLQEVLGIVDLTDYSSVSGTGTVAIKSTITSPAANQVLTWNGSNWINSNPLVQSIFSRTGNIIAQTGDYTAAQVTNAFDITTVNSLTETSLPSTPPSGFGKLWFDSTDEILKIRDDDGLISSTIRPTACSGTDKVSAITPAGLIICTADQSGAGSGIITLNGLNVTDQNFVPVSDTNVTLSINSSSSSHTFTVGWAGTLAKSRQNSATVYNDQANTFGAFLQRFQAGANFEFQDPTDTTKIVRFDLSNISTSTTRTITIPNANSTAVISDTGTTNNFLTAISSTGVISKAQPTFANLSGSATDAQVPDAISITSIPNQTTNGFIKTIGGNGTLFIDTTTYLSSIANNSINGAMIALGSDAQGDIMFYNGTDWVRLAAGTSGQTLTTQGTGANPIWSASGSGDVTLAGIQTFTGAHTFNAAKLIVGTNAGAPTVVANSFYRDTGDGKLYIGRNDGSSWDEIFESGVTGTIDPSKGGTGNSTYTKGDILVASNSTTLVKLSVGTNGQCIKANSATTSGLEYGTCGSGGGSGDVVGPASATDNAVVRYDTTTGKLIQNSGVTIDDSDNISSAGSLTIGVGSSVAGSIELGQGTLTIAGTNSIILSAPTSVTSYRIVLPSTASTGIPHFANSSGIITTTISAIDLTTDITGDLPYANFVPATAASKLVGRGSASGAGDFQEITIGSGLTMSGTTLSASGGGGSGDVVGPASATDNAIVRFDSTTGKLIQDSAVTIADTTGNISSPGNISLGVGGSGAGFLELTQGTAPSLGTTSIIVYAPTSVTSYGIVYPSAAATGIPHFSNSSNIMTMSISAINLASADVTGTLPVANGGSGVATITGIIKGNGTSAFSVATAGTDYTSPSSTETFTNKTLDVEGTGNLFTSPKRLWFDAAGCNGTTASVNFDLPTSSAPTATCTGTTTTVGSMDYIDASTTGATRSFRLPSTFTGNVDINLIWFANSTSTNAVRWQVSLGCVADSEAISTGPSYNTASASNEAYVGGTANLRDSTAFANVSKTNCAAGETAWIKVERVGGDAGDTLASTAELLGMEVVIRTAE